MKQWFPLMHQGGWRDCSTCTLHLEGPYTATSLQDAWRLLPSEGEGWICLASEIRHFAPEQREGWLLHAEVVNGSQTISLRLDEGCWRAWTWQEKEGNTHRVVRERYLSSVPHEEEHIPQMLIATYWELQQDHGLSIWQPVGSRFCGWEK